MKKKAISLQRAAHWSACGPLRFVILSRLSDDEQAIGADTSLDAQERLCKLAVGRYISEHGGQLVTCIRGEKTGTTLKRSDWKEVLTLAEKRAFDVLVSVRMDRVARGSTYSVAEHLLTEDRIAIWVTEDRFDAGAGGKVMKAAYLFRDGAYAAFVGEAVRSHQRDAVVQGYWPGGVYPYGMMTITAPGMVDVPLSGGKVRRAPRVATAHPDQIGHVEEALRLVVKHRTLAPAVEYLRQNTEREWSAKSTRSLLTSPVFAGELHWGDHVNPTAHAPLVPSALWEEAQGILSRLETLASARQSGKRGTVTYNRSAHSEEAYLLRGLVRCNHCRSLMSTSWATGKAGKVLYYECAHARAYKSSGCPVRRVNATSLESALLEEIFRTIAHPARMRKWMEAAAEQLTAGRAEELEDEQRRVRRNLQEAKRKITNLVAAIKAAAIAPDALPPLVEALGEQEKQRERLEARIAQLTTSLRSSRRRISASVACRAWADLPETWELATPEEQRTIVASLVDRIDLTGRDGETKEIQGTFSLIIENPFEQNTQTDSSCGFVEGRFDNLGNQCTRRSRRSKLTTA